MLGRIGGEELLLLMSGRSLDESEVILERLHRQLKPHAGVP
jgi:GGDEF domain-containing protein